MCDTDTIWYLIYLYSFSKMISHITMHHRYPDADVDLTMPHLNSLPLASSTGVTTCSTNGEAGNFPSPPRRNLVYTWHMSNWESSPTNIIQKCEGWGFFLNSKTIGDVYWWLHLTSEIYVQSCFHGVELQILKNCNHLEVKTNISKPLKTPQHLRSFRPKPTAGKMSAEST